jgi:hypothetical protein
MRWILIFAMRRLLVALGSTAALAAAGVLAAGVGAGTVSARPAPAAVHAQPRSSAAPHRSALAEGGHVCFVSVPRCSETPCIEYIQSATAAVARSTVPGVRLASPRCRSSKLSTKVRRSPTAPPNFGLALPALAHKLQARPAGSP